MKWVGGLKLNQINKNVLIKKCTGKLYCIYSDVIFYKTCYI